MPIGGAGEGHVVTLRAVVGIDDYPLGPSADDMVKCVSDQWPIADRDERFRHILGERPEARAEAGSEDERIFHGRSIAGTLVFAKTMSVHGVRVRR
jgi:hypothetical protein